MKTIRVLDSSGDTCIEFDETPATAEQKARAKAVFDDWMAEHKPAFLTNRAGGQPDLKITDFSQVEEGADTILVPLITAG